MFLPKTCQIPSIKQCFYQKHAKSETLSNVLPETCQIRSIKQCFWHPFKIILGSFWQHFKIILGSFWDHSGIILGSFWDHFGMILMFFSKNDEKSILFNSFFHKLFTDFESDISFC